MTLERPIRKNRPRNKSVPFFLLFVGQALAADPVADCDRLAAHPEDPQKVTPGLDAAQIDYRAATAACEAAVAAEPANMRARYQLARVLFYANQNQRAVEQMRIAADAGYVQAQYIYATFIVRGRPYAPKDICLADQYWRKAAAAGRQSARVQYVRHALRDSFVGCPGAATWQQMRAMLDAAAKDAAGIYQQALVEDLGEALAARLPDAAHAAWRRCATELGTPPDQPVRLRRFGDTPQATDRLNALILSGEKTITATTPWVYASDRAKRPFEGGYSVMTDAAGIPRAVLRTTQLRTMPFDQVTEAQSQYEGKPVRPIAEWRRVHQEHFDRTLQPLGRKWAPDMPVTLERFEVACRAP
ncbi:MAG: ASCH domain-containing protein [Steroidobacteraceae bacterium]|jgi:uncharacterized protein YhfF|nr:ASCH domain-containing protein [Steroidobacteraceae bacterium]